ncbi:hypothetical protein ACFU7D_12990 [Nocardioides sp. NPDC057577]|uniref:hypothetical protein n=1 Tax=Nocardioides sp. NPDC057577 TaxID=3346171 RepID=UPI00366C999B
MGQPPQRASIVTRGSRWRRGVRISGLLVVAAALAALSLWWLARGSGPAEVTRDFLETTSVATLYELASEEGDGILDGGGANDMVRVAEGKRTYSDPSPQTLTRTLAFQEAVVEGSRAIVGVRVSYEAEDGSTVPDDGLVVWLAKVGDHWRVTDWKVVAASG